MFPGTYTPFVTAVRLSPALRVKSSNIVLTPEGQPIIGHNLVLDSPSLTSKKSAQELDAWLKNQFYKLVILVSFIPFVVYGNLSSDFCNNL